MDVRLKTESFPFNGKNYPICCNMNVLADVQEAFGGNFMSALKNPASLKTSLVFLAAMLNDCADSNGWPERFTPKEVGRQMACTAEDIRRISSVVSTLVTSSVLAGTSAEAEERVADEKN